MFGDHAIFTNWTRYQFETHMFERYHVRLKTEYHFIIELIFSFSVKDNEVMFLIHLFIVIGQTKPG